MGVKNAQATLQNIITWTKKYRKKEAKMGGGMWHWKSKTLIKTTFQSKVIIVEKTLEFKHLTSLCLTEKKRCHFIRKNT